jgi:hypothetical protein
VVRKLAATVPFIVFDARVVSDGLVEEARHVFQCGSHVGNALIVTNDDGTVPVLDKASVADAINVARSTVADRSVGALKSMGLTETFSPDEGPGTQKNFERHTKRIGGCMHKAAALGSKLRVALGRAERASGRNDFTEAARALEKQLDGPPGAGALEIFADLPADISSIERFLEEWGGSQMCEYRDLIRSMRAIHGALCELQRALDAMPPALQDWNVANLKEAAALSSSTRRD